jgi:triacylglycerol lipase
MAPLEAVEPTPVKPTLASPSADLQLYDTLASANRLWLRGRLSLPAGDPAGKRSWWERWRPATQDPTPVLLAQVQTQVGGEVLTAEVPLQSDGEFEVTFEAPLPEARRGWRVARNHVTVNGQTHCACSVVLTPPALNSSGIVVVLPLAFTYEPAGVQQLTQSVHAARLTEVLRDLTEGGTRPVYYLCCVPCANPHTQTELALAATSLGWPSGQFVLLSGRRAGAAETLVGGLDRLRWLFAEQLDFLVLNQEPAAEAALAAAVGAHADRAAVSRYFGSQDDLRTVQLVAGGHAPALVRHAFRPTRSHCVPRHPIVFCHGMLAISMLRMQLPEDTNYFIHLRPFLRERGIQALYPNVIPTGGVAERAEQVRDEIRRWTDDPVNLIAHSMGGLDARFLIARLGMADRVRSLTTISSPHHGTYVADWFCLHYRERVPLLLALEAFGVNVDGFRDCRTDICRTFNENTPNAAGVRYFSYTATVPCSRVSPLLRRGWNLLTPQEGPNDGLVSVRSSAWGEVLGKLAVDHFAQTPDGLFVRDAETFDPLGFYFNLIEDLAHRGL